MKKNKIHATHTFKGALRSGTALSAALVFTSMSVQSAFALPQGAQVQQGNVQLDQQGNTLNVNQASQKAVINWQSFDIGAGEATHFHQPNSSAIALNRITGSQLPSQIFGTLTANGKIILINPNGVVFGQGSQVDVGSLIASTANITDENFFNETFHFSEAGNPNAKIVNLGSISAADSGLVALIAPGVENHGLIQAKQGSVVLAGGETATLDMFGDGLLNLAVSGTSTGVDNQGVIQAEGGNVVMTAQAARGVVDNLVNTDGVIEASSATRKGGSIILGGGSGKVRVAGKVKATGKTGGKIEVTGDVVALETATIDASGEQAGGYIRVGGDKRGANELQMASLTTVDNASVIKANATITGEGGDIALWSTDVTDFDGHVEAKGVSKGGFVEVSSTGELGFTGSVDLSASEGANGTLLLDPDNVVIGTKTNHDGELSDRKILDSDGTGTYYVSSGAVVAALDVADVVIEALKSITVNDIIDARANSKSSNLTLDAANITLNKMIALNDGSLRLYGNKLTLNQKIDLGTGNLALGTQGDAGGAIASVLLNSNGVVNANNFRGGTITNFTQKGVMNLAQDFDAEIVTKMSATGKTTAGRDYTITGNGTVTVAQIDARKVNIAANKLYANKQIDANGAIVLSGDTLVQTNSAATLTTQNGNISVTSANGGVTLKGAVDASENIDVTAKKSVSIYKALEAGNKIDLDADISIVARGDVSAKDIVADAGKDVTFSKSITATDDVTLNAANRMTLNGNAVTADKLNLTSGSNMSTKGLTARLIDVTATNGAITTNGDVVATNGAITIAGAKRVTTKKLVDAQQGSVDISSSNGNLSLQGDVNAQGAVELDAKKSLTTKKSVSGSAVTAQAGANATMKDVTATANDVTITVAKTANVTGTVQAADEISLTGTSGIKGNATLSAGGNVEVTSNGDARLGGVTSGKTVTLDANRNVYVNGDVDATNLVVADRANTVSLLGETTVTNDVTIDSKTKVTLGGEIDAGGDLNISLNAVTVSNPDMSIQYAIDLVNDGGTVTIKGGTYTQHSLVLNRNVVVQGAGRDKTTIDASGGDYAFIVGAGAHNGDIKNLTISGAQKDAIHIDTSGVTLGRFTLNGVRLSDNAGSGISLADNSVVNKLTISNVRFERNGADGIAANANATLHNLNVASSQFTDNAGAGIAHAKGNNMLVRTSVFDGNGTGIAVAEENAGDVNYVRIYDNRFTGDQDTHVSINGDFDVRNKKNKASDAYAQLSGENTYDTQVQVLAEEGGAWQADATGAFALYGTMGKAAADAEAGDWLEIAAGTYTESFGIDKALTLSGAGSDKTFLHADGKNAITLNTAGGEAFALAGMQIEGGDVGLLANLPSGGFSFDDVIFKDQLVSAVRFANASRSYDANDLRGDVQAVNTKLLSDDYVSEIVTRTPVRPRGVVGPAPASQNRIFTQINQFANQQQQGNGFTNIGGQTTPILNVNAAGQSQGNSVVQDLERISDDD